MENMKFEEVVKSASDEISQEKKSAPSKELNAELRKEAKSRLA